tara:strand:- start:3116 stop:4480 length:1365 start_codon:yes stop_codon:yes gene_type:complete
MKEKIFKNALESFVNAFSKNNSKEAKKNSRIKLAASTPFFSGGAVLQYLNINNQTPLEVLQIFQAYNIDHTYAALTLYGIGSAILLTDPRNESPLQEELAQYGSDYCPYESFSVANNDLKGKAIQMKINRLHNLSFQLGNGSIVGKTTKFVANVSERALNSFGKSSRPILDFFGKGEYGFELMNHNNPRLVKYMPVPKGLKQVISPEGFDSESPFKKEEEKFVYEVRERAMSRTKEEILERNIILALVKVIDKIKMGKEDRKDINALKKLKTIKCETSQGNIKRYDNINEITKILSKEEEDIETIRNLDIPEWDSNLRQGERAFHILKELDKITESKNIEMLKKPMTYRELYRNELIIATQFKLRSPYEKENIEIQKKSPLIKTHFVNTIKDYYRDLKNISTVNLVGTTLEEYPTHKAIIEEKERQEAEKQKLEELNNNKLKEEKTKKKIRNKL